MTASLKSFSLITLYDQISRKCLLRNHVGGIAAVHSGVLLYVCLTAAVYCGGAMMVAAVHDTGVVKQMV